MPDEKSSNPIPPNLPISSGQPTPAGVAPLSPTRPTTPAPLPSVNTPSTSLPQPNSASVSAPKPEIRIAPQPPILPPAKPVVPSLPIVPTPAATVVVPPVVNKEINAMVRTMESDIKSVGQNLPNKGVEVKIGGQAISAIKMPVTPVAPTTPITPTAPANPNNVALGPSEKRTNPLSNPAIPSPQKPTPLPVAPAGIVLPPVDSKKKIRPLFLGLILLVAVVVGLGIYWFMAPGNQPSPTPFPTRTPSPTAEVSATPSATPGPVDDLNTTFTSHGAITLTASSSTQFIPALYGQLGTVAAAGVKNVFLAPAIVFSDFMRLSSATNLPATTNGLDNPNFGLIISRQTEKFSNKGALLPNSPVEQRLGLVVGVKDATITTTWLIAWEKNMASDLSALFKLGTSTNNVVFKNNSYRGLNIRYANFTQPDRSIDYAVVRAVNGRSYLVIANSREQIYGIIDNLLGF